MKGFPLSINNRQIVQYCQILISLRITMDFWHQVKQWTYISK